MSDDSRIDAAAELAVMLKRWRGVTPDRPHGMFPASRAAQLLGLSVRTLEGIEQGRGFRYPRLITLAIASFGDEAPLLAERG